MAASDKNHFLNEEKRIVELCERFKQGITLDVIKNDMPHLKNNHIVEILNSLLSKHKLNIHERPDKTLVYKLKDPVTQLKLKGIDIEDQAIYQIIERSGRQGIWARKIRAESNLHQNTVDKVLKRLENKKLIKSISSIQATKKKIYLLYGVEPDPSLTGGAFHTNNQFDSDFVNVLMDLSFKYLENKLRKAEEKLCTGSASYSPLSLVNETKVTTKEMLDYIQSTNVVKGVNLGTDDVEKLLEALVLDGRVKCFTTCSPSSGSEDGETSVKLYRAVPDWAPTPCLLSAPCGICPNVSRCSRIGRVTPTVCSYLDDWLTCVGSKSS